MCLFYPLCKTLCKNDVNKAYRLYYTSNGVDNIEGIFELPETGKKIKKDLPKTTGHGRIVFVEALRAETMVKRPRGVAV